MVDESHMKSVYKFSLIAILSLLGVLVLSFGVLVFLYSDFFSAPKEKECIRLAERFLGYKLGRDNEVLDYDADYSHPDRPLSFTIKIPNDRFQALVDYCRKEVALESESTRAKDGKYDIITSPINQSSRGYEKTKEVLWGEDRVHYQTIEIIPDKGTIEYVEMSY
jgi:hypothetical protein